MRDPLRNVSVRYKLVLAFLGVCLLAFGVGGFLVSRSARESLEREILKLLRFQSQSHATMLEGELRRLQHRVRDFASDGYIRSRFESGNGKAQETALLQHLRLNKLPLEPAFVDLALIAEGGGPPLLAGPGDGAWAREVPARALGDADWFSGLLSAVGAEQAPAVVLATPLRSLDGDRPIGTLLARVHAGAWIVSALAAALRDPDVHESEMGLRLIDPEGRTLEIPRALVEQSPPVEGPGPPGGVGLRVREPQLERGHSRVPVRGVLSQIVPIGQSGWTLETTMQTNEALAAVSGLQARFLIVGVVLTAITTLFLLFPMRFLARPILRLRDAAKQIREGDFNARVPIESEDEIGELSRSFNSMAAAVQERTVKLEATAASLEQRRNELRRERDRLNAVILSMRDGLIVLDPDGRPEVWNAAAEPLLNAVSAGQVAIGAHRNCQRASEHANGHGMGDEHPCLTCLFEPAAPPRSCLIDVGSSVYEVHSTRLSADAGGRSGRVLVAREVTDRVAQDEREIHQERLAVLGEVAAVMAHELNNPLASIRMFTQMIGSGLEGDSPLQEHVGVIERNTQTCSRTIRELLDYATGATPEVGPVDVHANLREMSSFLRAFRERKEAELVLELGAEDPVVVGDEVQLRQVFVNLVLNAFQAAGEGTVTVRTWLDGTHLVVDVHDTGPGVDPELAESIFRPFYTTKPRGSGTGLGLSTARRITEIQGGGLGLADGRPGHTTFRVRLLRGQS